MECGKGEKIERSRRRVTGAHSETSPIASALHPPSVTANQQQREELLVSEDIYTVTYMQIKFLALCLDRMDIVFLQ